MIFTQSSEVAKGIPEYRAVTLLLGCLVFSP